VIYAPESKIKYSNGAIATVGYVLEKLKGEPFASYLRKNVLLPMGLTHSAFEPLPDITDRLADATMWSYDGRVFDAPTFELGMSPAGSMYAPIVDLGQFMKVLFNDGKGPNGPVIKKETLQLMLTSQFNDRKDQRHNVGFGIGFSLSEQGRLQARGSRWCRLWIFYPALCITGSETGGSCHFFCGYDKYHYKAGGHLCA
jgi:CubicO group peptidase (beta-lactamase class C family)